MHRSDRSATRFIAEIGLDRARPVLLRIAPALFASLDIAAVVKRALPNLEPDMPYATHVRPGLIAALGTFAPQVMAWIERFPAGSDADYPATSFWLTTLWDLESEYSPLFANASTAGDWTAFIAAYSRSMPVEAVHGRPWLADVVSDRAHAKAIDAIIAAERATPLTVHDRGLYAHFRWNDDGDSPGLTGLATGIWRFRLQRAWRAAMPYFDDADRKAIEQAAMRLARAGLDARRSEGAQDAEADAARYGVSAADILGTFYGEPVAVPALADIEREAS